MEEFVTVCANEPPAYSNIYLISHLNLKDKKKQHNEIIRQ